MRVVDGGRAKACERYTEFCNIVYRAAKQELQEEVAALEKQLVDGQGETKAAMEALRQQLVGVQERTGEEKEQNAIVVGKSSKLQLRLSAAEEAVETTGAELERICQVAEVNEQELLSKGTELEEAQAAIRQLSASYQPPISQQLTGSHSSRQTAAD